MMRARILELKNGRKADKWKADCQQGKIKEYGSMIKNQSNKIKEQGTKIARLGRELAKTQAEIAATAGAWKLFAKTLTGQMAVDKV